MQNNEIYSVYMHIFPNGKRYVGITSQQISRRWREGKGYKSQEMFTRAINKYGWDNIQHIILYDKLTKEQAEEKEIELIKKYRTNIRKYGYNIEAGGSSARGYKLSKETRKKMSKSRTGEKNWLYGKHLTEETKKKLSIAHMGKCDIEATRRGAKKRMGKNAYNAKKVIQYDKNYNIIAIFDSMADAFRATNTKVITIYSCCKGRNKTGNGYIWRYYEQETICKN